MVLFQIGGLIKASPRNFLSRELAKVKNQSMKVTGGNSSPGRRNSMCQDPEAPSASFIEYKVQWLKQTG